MCVGDNGCNGCVDLGLDDNNGLRPAVDALNRINALDDVEPYMTKADLWALAGITAVEFGIQESNEYHERKTK